jgi:hypothetical protein
MLSKTEKEKTLTFLALLQATYEMADDLDFRARPFDKPIIKERTWELTRTINKQISKILPMEDCDKPDWDNAVSQHVDAAERMMEFFRIGLRLQELDPIKVQGFDTQLNILLKTYGIE